MKKVQINIVDANTGEVICQTKSNTLGSTHSVRDKVMRNVNSFVRYLDSYPDRDVCLQILVRDEVSPLSITFPSEIADVY